MRRGEILGLTWDHVDFDRRVITLTHTKNGRTRRLPMHDLVFETLKRRARGGPYVFGGNEPYRRITTGWRAACRRAGLGRLRFHDLRHTWASWLVEDGLDLRAVQELGGWSSLKLLERYAHPTTATKVNALGLIGARLKAADGHHLDTNLGSIVAARRLSTL